MPTLAERGGDLLPVSADFRSAQRAAVSRQVVIPTKPDQPAGQGPAELYPLPNFEGARATTTRFRWPASPIRTALQSRFNQRASTRRIRFSAPLLIRAPRSDTPNLFGFLDRSEPARDQRGTSNWPHRSLRGSSVLRIRVQPALRRGPRRSSRIARTFRAKPESPGTTRIR